MPRWPVGYVNGRTCPVCGKGKKFQRPACSACSTPHNNGWGTSRHIRPLAERIDRLTFKFQGEDACWIWLGSRRQGYGLIRQDNGRCVSAHRAAYEVATGETLRDDDVVMHKCDIPCCVRPDHLQLGTPRDNAIDMLLKGRVAHVVDIRSVSAIRARWLELRGDSRSGRKRGLHRLEILANEFGVSRGTIGDIVRRRTWKHV